MEKYNFYQLGESMQFAAISDSCSIYVRSTEHTAIIEVDTSEHRRTLDSKADKKNWKPCSEEKFLDAIWKAESRIQNIPFT